MGVLMRRYGGPYPADLHEDYLWALHHEQYIRLDFSERFDGLGKTEVYLEDNDEVYRTQKTKEFVKRRNEEIRNNLPNWLALIITLIFNSVSLTITFIVHYHEIIDAIKKMLSLLK